MNAHICFSITPVLGDPSAPPDLVERHVLSTKRRIEDNQKKANGESIGANLTTNEKGKRRVVFNTLAQSSSTLRLMNGAGGEGSGEEEREKRGATGDDEPVPPKPPKRRRVSAEKRALEESEVKINYIILLLNLIFIPTLPMMLHLQESGS